MTLFELLRITYIVSALNGLIFVFRDLRKEDGLIKRLSEEDYDFTLDGLASLFCIVSIIPFLNTMLLLATISDLISMLRNRSLEWVDKGYDFYYKHRPKLRYITPKRIKNQIIKKRAYEELNSTQDLRKVRRMLKLLRK